MTRTIHITNSTSTMKICAELTHRRTPNGIESIISKLLARLQTMELKTELQFILDEVPPMMNWLKIGECSLEPCYLL